MNAAEDEEWDTDAEPLFTGDAQGDYLALVKADIEWWEWAQHEAHDRLVKASAALLKQPSNSGLARERETAEAQYHSIASARYLCEQFYEAVKVAIPHCPVRF